MPYEVVVKVNEGKGNERGEKMFYTAESSTFKLAKNT